MSFKCVCVRTASRHTVSVRHIEASAACSLPANNIARWSRSPLALPPILRRCAAPRRRLCAAGAGLPGREAALGVRQVGAASTDAGFSKRQT
eukprot:6183581-Pleurochrysis_carterae.AAC.1